MKRVSVLMLIVFACLVSGERLQAQRPTSPPNVNPRIPHFPIKPGFPKAPHLLRRAEAARLPAKASPNIIPTQCPPEAQALADDAGLTVTCSYLPVPLDRKHPKQAKIRIYFELYRGASEPTESAILYNEGGPGYFTSGVRADAFLFFGSILDHHDLLLIDDRGRGLSDAIDCEELQHGTAPYDQALADCAAQLGNAASRYGTGDVAQDTDDVRAALGYDRVDYFGMSYGGADEVAYASRFGEHVRSMVLDSPFGPPEAERFAFERYQARAKPRMVRLDCLRSPTCSADHPFPDAELDALIWTLRFHPVEGDAYDANGNLVHVRIDDQALLTFLFANDSPQSWGFAGNFIAVGELLAAARSLWLGDPLPLLRLGAESIYSLDGLDYGDPTVYSEADWAATLCSDIDVPWKWSDPVFQRKAEYADAISDLPNDYFAPFAKSATTNLVFSSARECLSWEKPTPSSPIAPPHAIYPHAPVLVLSGDQESSCPLEESSKVAALFPNSTFLPVAETGHAPTTWTHCAFNLVAPFIDTLKVGDTSCTKTPEAVWPAVGRFPLFAKDARPAQVDLHGHNQIGLAERKVVTVAVAAATDAMQRSMIGYGQGAGLRGGSFSTDFGNFWGLNTWTTSLSDSAFAKDVTVTGTVTWEVEVTGIINSYGPFAADLTVNGAGTAGGSLHVEGTWQAPGPVGNFKVRGKLGGKQVAVLVPEA
jgi:pimeloyl-ACP methyl ester carboxylesterase